MAQKDAFIIPAHPQRRARLLQLPAELRLKILRFLLKRPGAILTKEEIRNQMKDERYDEGTYKAIDEEDYEQRWKAAMSHSGQILRTCQQIFHEGQDVLYGENVLSLYTASAYDDDLYGQFVWILDSIISYPHKLSEHPPPHNDGLLSYAAASYDCHGEERTCKKLEHQWVDTEFSGEFASLQPMLERFKKFQVTVGYEDDDVGQRFDRDKIICHIAARAFRDIVRNKHVVLHYRSFSNSTKAGRGPSIDSFRVWRCASFKFAESAGTEIIEVEKLVCSNEPASDTLVMWRSLRKQLEMLPLVETVAFVNQERSLVELLKGYALKYDEEAFETARRNLLERIGQWMLDWADQADGLMPEREQ